MMVNRLVLGVMVLAAAGFLAFGGERPAQDFYHEGLPWVCAYLLIVSLFQLHVTKRAGPSPARRIAAICADAAIISFGLRQGDAASACLFPLYFWMILGNGVRLGARYMGAAVASSAAGFAVNVWLTDFWHSHVALSAGLFASLIIIPIYGGLLLRRLAEAHAEAERANHAKTLLLACVSHELRTPLTAIIGLGALLQKTELDSQQREMVQTLSNAGGILLRHIEALLTVARDEIGQEPQRPERVDLFALLCNLRGLLAVEADKKGVRLGLCIDADTPRHVLAEPALLLDILQNLGGNAVKFTQSGAVAIHVGVISRDDAATELKIEVRDTGLGIARSAQARIFESFVQADPGITRRFGGSGLGLAIARRRLEARGGHIDVDSEPGKGSRFWFDLKVGRDPVDGDPQPNRPVNGQSRRTAFDAASFCADENFDGPQKSDPVLIALPGSGDASSRACDALALARRFCIAVVAHEDDPIDLDRAHEIVRCLQAIAAAPAGAAARAASPQGWARTPLKLLLAEDNGVNRMVLEKILVQGGHSTRVVPDGEAALDAMLAERFDVILLDVNMPGIDGPEVARLYRFAPLRTHAPIIALTADASNACQEECARAGMVACLTKPLEPETLLAAVSDAFTGRRGASAGRFVANAMALEAASDVEPLAPGALAALAKLGGEDFLRELLGQFLEEGKQIIERMVAAVEDGDLQAFQHEAHALASSAGNIGAAGLARLCRCWRATEREEFVLYGDDFLDGLRREWSRLATELSLTLAKTGSARGAAIKSRRDDAAA